MPVRHHRDQLVMEPGCTLAKQGEPPQHDHPWLWITAGQHAGAAEFMVQKALAEEPAQQPLHQTVLQMQMHRLGAEAAWIGEDHRPHWVLAAPLIGVGLLWLDAAQAVQGAVPASVTGLADQLLWVAQLPAGLPLGIGAGLKA